jgi:hypothetical protein
VWRRRWWRGWHWLFGFSNWWCGRCRQSLEHLRNERHIRRWWRWRQRFKWSIKLRFTNFWWFWRYRGRWCWWNSERWKRNGRNCRFGKHGQWWWGRWIL